MPTMIGMTTFMMAVFDVTSVNNDTTMQIISTTTHEGKDVNAMRRLPMNSDSPET